MPSAPRKELIRDGEPGIYHLWQRCVRRAFLMGTDSYTGKDYSHRKGWVEARLEMLTASFGIGVCCYSVLDNHLHLIVRVSPSVIDALDDYEVARRWLRVYPGYRVLDENWHQPTNREIRALAENKDEIAQVRKKLKSISCFMAALSEYIARRANKEEENAGRFWQGRFGSRQLADEAAVLACAMYVDLNELKAGIARTLEECRHSSVGKRIAETQGKQPCSWLVPFELRPEHYGEPMPSASGKRPTDRGLMSMTTEQYIRTLRWAAENYRSEVQCRPADPVASTLERLQLDFYELLGVVDRLPEIFRRFVGNVDQIRAQAATVNRRWFHGIRVAARLFGNGQPQGRSADSAESSEQRHKSASAPPGG